MTGKASDLPKRPITRSCPKRRNRAYTAERICQVFTACHITQYHHRPFHSWDSSNIEDTKPIDFSYEGNDEHFALCIRSPSTTPLNYDGRDRPERSWVYEEDVKDYSDQSGDENRMTENEQSAAEKKTSSGSPPFLG
jgi:hypothetical protein